jgi:hypothetical protein
MSIALFFGLFLLLAECFLCSLLVGYRSLPFFPTHHTHAYTHSLSLFHSLARVTSLSVCMSVRNRSLGTSSSSSTIKP